MTPQLAVQQQFGPKPLLICFSHLRWRFVHQRPQHLLTRATSDYSVAYFEEPVFEGIRAPNLRRDFCDSGVVVLTPVIPSHYSVEETNDAQIILLESFLAAEDALSSVFWYYTPIALTFTAHLARDVTVYDCMDELSAFKLAHPSLRAFEQELFHQADVVFTGGWSLYEAKKRQHNNIHAFPSSIDANHFHKARTRSGCPADTANIPGPQLGYFGVIDERMDLDLLDQMATSRPDWNFIMIGPVVKIDEAALPTRANIHWLGGRDYRVLPDYIAAWNVGLMPFALNESTKYISPTKTPEYLAAGCPVVSTAIADVVNPYGAMGLVEIAGTAAEAITAAEMLMQRDREPWLKAVDAHLRGNSWDRTWAHMQDEITRCLNNDKAVIAARKMIGA